LNASLKLCDVPTKFKISKEKNSLCGLWGLPYSLFFTWLACTKSLTIDQLNSDSGNGSICFLTMTTVAVLILMILAVHTKFITIFIKSRVLMKTLILRHWRSRWWQCWVGSSFAGFQTQFCI
jgi:hypothetical protein